MGRFRIYTRSGQETLEALLERSRAGRLVFSHLTVREGSLEDVFLNLTGHRLREWGATAGPPGSPGPPVPGRGAAGRGGQRREGWR